MDCALNETAGFCDKILKQRFMFLSATNPKTFFFAKQIFLFSRLVIIVQMFVALLINE